MEKRLFRNEHDKVVGGVSSGLAEYMQVDITIIRLLFVLATVFLVGTGLLVYIVLWIVLPVNNDPIARFTKFNEYFQKTQQHNAMFNSPNAFNNPSNATEQTKWNTPNVGPDFKQDDDFNKRQKGNDTGRTVGGLILLVVGIFCLLRYTFDVIPHFFNIFKIYKLWPLAIVVIGISLIFRNQRKTEWDNFKKTTEDAQKGTPEKPVEEVVIVEEKKDPETPIL